MTLDPMKRARLADAAKESADELAALGDPTERYSEAVILAGWYQEQAAAVVQAASPGRDEPELPADDG